MESILKNYLNQSSSDSEQVDKLLSNEDNDLYKDYSEEEHEIGDQEEEEVITEQVKPQKQKLPSFMQAMTYQSKAKGLPKYIQRKDNTQITEFDLLHSYKQKAKEEQEQDQKKESKMIIEQVIEKKSELTEGNIDNVIEQAIEQQNKKVPAMQKSRVTKSRFDVRQQKRQKNQAKEDRSQRKRQSKQQDKESEKLTRFKGDQ